MIIGLTGTMGAGKGEIVKILKERGFEHYVYSDILKNMAAQRHIEPTRANLQKLGTDVKNESKNLGILSRKLLAQVLTDKVVVDGIRNVDEIIELRKAKQAYIIGVTAPQRIRFRRIRSRARSGDPQSFLEFKHLDNIENRGKTRGQEINACIAKADEVINNVGSVDALRKRIHQTIDKLLT